jgi:hypothetical protein
LGHADVDALTAFLHNFYVLFTKKGICWRQRRARAGGCGRCAMGYLGPVVCSLDGPGKNLWRLTWGVVFVLAMTALSEWGPRLGYSKTAPDATQGVSLPVVQIVK